MKKTISFLFSLIIISGVHCQQIQKISSPNKELCLKAQDFKGKAYYMLTRGRDTIVDYSCLSLRFKDVSLDNLQLKDMQTTNFDETWQCVWGEESEVRNHYNELAMNYVCNDLLLTIRFRVFDDGMAFRYEISDKNNKEKALVLMSEDSEITLTRNLAGSTIWSQKANNTLHYEALYTSKPANTEDTINPPATFVCGKDLFLCLNEAAVWDYPATNFIVNDIDGRVRFKTNLYPYVNGDAARLKTPAKTPWRYLIVAHNEEELLLSRINLNLNEPCAIEDVSWIKPSKYVGIWWGMHKRDYTWEYGPKHGATTERAKQYIDFAAEHNLPAVLVEGWNLGWEGDWGIHGDRFNFTTPYPDYDLEQVCNYAKEKGVRIIAHMETGGSAYNLEKQMDSAFALYQRLGINTIKTGYVNIWNDDQYQHSQKAINHYNLVVKTAAKYKLMVVAHEAALPSGLRRTYPNLIGTECMRGQEYNSWDEDGGNPPYHTCILPFTRGLCGPMDFTPGIFNFENKIKPQTHPQTTLAKQLAEYIVLYSPAPMAADMIENYAINPEAFTFIEKVATNWEKTLVPHAEIGHYITIARKERGTDTWFIGSMTDQDARDLTLDLNFLDKDKEYNLTIYQDGQGADYRTNPYPVEIKTMQVKKDDKIPLHLAPSGGAAIIIQPK